MRQKEALAFVYRLRNQMFPEQSKERIYLSEVRNLVYWRLRYRWHIGRYFEHKNKGGLVDCSVLLKQGHIYHIFQYANTSEESLAELVKMFAEHPYPDGMYRCAA